MIFWFFQQSRNLSSRQSEPSRGVPYTSELREATLAVKTDSPLPAYRVMDMEGKVIDDNEDPQVHIYIN